MTRRGAGVMYRIDSEEKAKWALENFTRIHGLPNRIFGRADLAQWFPEDLYISIMDKQPKHGHMELPEWNGNE